MSLRLKAIHYRLSTSARKEYPTAGPTIVAACCAFLLMISTGCQSRSLAPATAPSGLYVTPPVGWVEESAQVTAQSSTRVWVSPSGATALGEIRFTLPFPVGHEWALWGFLQNMKKSEGRADLIEKQWDSSMNVLRFVAEGGRYRVRTNLFVRDSAGVAIFAGTLIERPVNDDELSIAEQARDAVQIQ